jgi:hypothetical protein
MGKKKQIEPNKETVDELSSPKVIPDDPKICTETYPKELDETLPPELESTISVNANESAGAFVIKSMESTITTPPVFEIPTNLELVEEVKEPETILVDKFLFFKMFRTCVLGQGIPTKNSAMVKFGAMLGAKTYQEQKIEWDKAQAYLANKNQSLRGDK